MAHAAAGCGADGVLIETKSKLAQGEGGGGRGRSTIRRRRARATTAAAKKSRCSRRLRCAPAAVPYIRAREGALLSPCLSLCTLSVPPSPAHNSLQLSFQMAPPDLHRAVRVGLAELRAALDAAPGAVNSLDRESGDSPLHEAALLGRQDCVQLLLDRGADVECQSQAREALRRACPSHIPKIEWVHRPAQGRGKRGGSHCSAASGKRSKHAHGGPAARLECAPLRGAERQCRLRGAVAAARRGQRLRG